MVMPTMLQQIRSIFSLATVQQPRFFALKDFEPDRDGLVQGYVIDRSDGHVITVTKGRNPDLVARALNRIYETDGRSEVREERS